MTYSEYDGRLYDKMDRINRIYEGRIFNRIGELDNVEGVETKDHLRQPPEKGWIEWKSGMIWGGEYMNLWTKGSFAVPKEMTGKDLYILPETGAQEGLVFVNGKPVGSLNQARGGPDGHYSIWMGKAKKAGETFQVAIDNYAWHNNPGCSPYENYGRDNAPDSAFKKTYTGIYVCVRDNDIFYFTFALRNLIQMARVLSDENVLKFEAQQTVRQIHAFLCMDPLHREYEVWHDSILRANELLRAFYAKAHKENPYRGYVGILGHSHMDTAWLWPYTETIRKCARTYANALAMMDKYPEYRFVQSSALHCDWMRTEYPTIFEDMKRRIAEGRYEVNGGVWVECDCNITSGELMVRQFLKGQEFYRNYFNKTTDSFWLPDTFGYSAAIPQIMKGCEVDYFYTTKMSWNDLNRFPYETFVWEGIDGTHVLTHLNQMHCSPDVATVTNALRGVQDKKDCPDRLVAFGFGDGGGGPNEQMIEDARITTALGGIPKVEYTTISDFMKRLQEKYTDLPVYKGELYLEKHRGTLTQAHDNKRNNRKAEFALQLFEFLNVLSGKPMNRRNDELVKVILKNQFHDILPGSSIQIVNETSRKEFTELFKAFRAEDEAYLNTMVKPDEDKIYALNPLSFDRSDLIMADGTIPGVEGYDVEHFRDMSGCEKTAIGQVTVPAYGAVSLTVSKKKRSRKSPFRYADHKLETPRYSVEFDPCGSITSLVHKETGREVRKPGSAPLNSLYVYEDVPVEWDNWDIDLDAADTAQIETRLISSEVIADGPLFFAIRNRYQLGFASSLMQDVIFYAGSDRIDFVTKLDWKEKRVLLKAGFDVDILSDTATHEIQYGHVQRTTKRNTKLDAGQFEVCNHKWTDISDTRFGVALLNDCKYGISVNGSDMRLSLHRGGCRPDASGDEGVHDLTYSLLPHAGALSTKNVIYPAYELNVPVVTGKGELNRPSYLTISSDHVICEALKPADQARKTVVARLYETERTYAETDIRLPEGARKVYLGNMLEDAKEELKISKEGTVHLSFHPFEIKTILIRF